MAGLMVLCLCSKVAQAFYLPGVAPQDFKKVGIVLVDPSRSCLHGSGEGLAENCRNDVSARHLSLSLSREEDEAPTGIWRRD